MRAHSPIDWTAYPALLIAGSFGLGILAAAVTGSARSLPWGLACGTAVALFVGAQWWDARRLVTLAPLGRMGAVLLAVAAAGGLSYAVYTSSSPRDLERVAKITEDDVVLSGTVEDAPERSENSVRFTLDVMRLAGPMQANTIDGAAVVTLASSPWASTDASFPVISEGDHVRLKGALQPAPGQRNPGGFDYAAYLARRGVCCTAYVDAPADVLEVDRARPPWTDLVVHLRRQVRGHIYRFVPSSQGRSVLEALLLADRSGLSERQQKQFATTGLMHLLAVSGLHVFLVGMVLYVLLQPLLLRLRLRWRTVEVTRAILTVTVLGFYLVLTGARPSVVRAVIMSGLFIGGVLFQRSTHSLNTLGVAALILLAIRPPALFDVGFQLSMTAVAGIVTLAPRVDAAVPDRWQESAVGDWLISMIGVSAAAMIGTAPVLLVHFGWVSGAGLVLNILAIPVTGLAMAAAIAMQVFGAVSSVLGAAFGSAADLFIRGLLLTSKYGSEWLGWFGLRASGLTPWTLVPLCAGIVSLVQWPRPRIRWRCLLLALLVATTGVWVGIATGPSRPTLDLIFFDVGQGDALLVSAPGNHHILVDSGPRAPDGESAADYSILPYLRQAGIDHLEAVVITHPDEDHLGGLPTLLREVSVGRVVTSGQPVETELYEESQRLLDNQEVPEVSARRGDTLSVSPNLRIDVLGPPESSRARGLDGVNERSVVLRLTYGETHILLPGDIESDAERDLVRTYGRQLSSSVVNVPHHGSSTSSTEGFVRATTDSTAPTRAVLSVGKSNSFDMPDEEVVHRWKRNGAIVSSTARDGAVWIRTDGRSAWRIEWQ